MTSFRGGGAVLQHHLGGGAVSQHHFSGVQSRNIIFGGGGGWCAVLRHHFEGVAVL